MIRLEFFWLVFEDEFLAFWRINHSLLSVVDHNLKVLLQGGRTSRPAYPRLIFGSCCHQTVGMTKEELRLPAVQKMYDLAKDVLGYDLQQARTTDGWTGVKRGSNTVVLSTDCY